jgi:hypothetical protein
MLAAVVAPKVEGTVALFKGINPSSYIVHPWPRW